MTVNKDLPKLADASGRLLQIGDEVLLRVRFGNGLFLVLLLVADYLTCQVLLRTKFGNLHIEAIFCQRGVLDFTHDTLPIMGRGNDKRSWNDKRAHVIELATLEIGDIVTVGDEYANLSKIRFAQLVEIPDMTQKKGYVITLL